MTDSQRVTWTAFAILFEIIWKQSVGLDILIAIQWLIVACASSFDTKCFVQALIWTQMVIHIAVEDWFFRCHLHSLGAGWGQSKYLPTCPHSRSPSSYYSHQNNIHWVWSCQRGKYHHNHYHKHRGLITIILFKIFEQGLGVEKLSEIRLGQSSLSKNWRSLFLSHSERKFNLTTVLRPCWPLEWRKRDCITSGCLKNCFRDF